MRIFRYLKNHFLRRVVHNNQGIIGAILGGLAAGAGSAAIGSLFGGDDEEGGFQTAPEYPEAKAARGEWWNRLQQWGADPYYGGIPQDWEALWESSKNKLNRYYWGGPEEGGGQAGKVRASAARRGVSESPALETELSRMGMAQGGQLADLNLQRILSEAQFGESSRQNWMSSLMQLSGQKPGSQYIPGTDSSAMYGELGGGIGDIIGQYQNQSWIEKLLESMGGTQGGEKSLNPGMTYAGQNIDWGLGKTGVSKGGFNSSLLPDLGLY